MRISYDFHSLPVRSLAQMVIHELGCKGKKLRIRKGYLDNEINDLPNNTGIHNFPSLICIQEDNTFFSECLLRN